MIGFVVLDLALLAVGEGDIGLMLAFGFLIGVSSGGLILLGVSMLQDTIDYDHHLTGQRREGIYAGVWSTIEKGSAAVATLFAGAILSSAGYLETRAGEIACQPYSALTAIQIDVAVVPAAVMLLSLLFLLRYDLTRERLGPWPRAGDERRGWPCRSDVVSLHARAIQFRPRGRSR